MLLDKIILFKHLLAGGENDQQQYKFALLIQRKTPLS
jgi:hypothetical protein